MCKKQELINQFKASSISLIERYNSVIQDREWIAMQAVSRINGFTYKGPWFAKEIQDLANLLEASKIVEENQCNDKSTDTHSTVEAEDGI